MLLKTWALTSPGFFILSAQTKSEGDESYGEVRKLITIDLTLWVNTLPEILQNNPK